MTLPHGHQPKPGPIPAAHLLPPLKSPSGVTATTQGGQHMPDRFDDLAYRWLANAWPAWPEALGHDRRISLAALLRGVGEDSRQIGREIADDLARLVREQGRDIEILRREAIALREARALLVSEVADLQRRLDVAGLGGAR